MDIVKRIDQHTKSLVDGLVSSSLEQRKSLAISILGFYYQLPKFKETIHQYIGIKVKTHQLISDINNGHTQNYQKVIEKSNADIDVYADNYEEPEPIEIFILDAFAGVTSDLKFSMNLVALFIGIIDTLDYYENFSDRPEFWNNLLEKEVEFQKEVLIQLGSKQGFDASMYQKRYKNVNFDEL
ncbi:hypothetical protein [Chryseobacterium balustinum]|uniref:hypothetical protein n=1 Tax=Chryseobacterium balustinum TaxID=246 RepID=UPI003CED34F9